MRHVDPFGDVPENYSEDPLSCGLDMGKSGLNRKLLAIGPDSGQYSRRSHRTGGYAFPPKTPNMFAVSCAQSFRDESVECCAERFRRGTPEDCFSCLIKDDDALLLIYGDHSVHGGVNDALQFRLTIPQGLLRPFARGVRSNGEEFPIEATLSH